MDTHRATPLLIVSTAASLLALSTFSAQADGFRNPPESASALGRIGGKIAHTDDPSAVTINPANIADFEEAEGMVSLSLGYAKREFDSPVGIHEETEEPWAYLPAFFAAWPIADGSAVAGVALTVPFGRFTDWDDDASFSQSSPYFAELKVININPTLATRLTDEVTVGVGVSFYWSDIGFKQRYPWSMLTGRAMDPDGTARFEGEGEGFGANAGVSWRVADGHVLAATYRSPFDIEYDGDFRVSNFPAEAAAAGASPSSDFETEINYPAIVGLGYGFRLTESIRVELDVEWIESSRNEELPVDIENNNALLTSRTIPQDWEDNWTYGMGMDWAFRPNWTARAGYIYLETPTRTQTTLPVASEENQGVVSLGLGYANESHAIDFAYAVGIFSGRSVEDNINPQVNGDYDHESHIVSVAYRRAL